MEKTGDSLKVFRRHDHTGREDLAEEHPWGDFGQIGAFILFLIVWAVDTFVFRFSTVLSAYVPLSVRIIFAALCFSTAGFLARSGLTVVFKEVRNPPQVINTGVFALVRHPIYLSALLLYLGFIFATLSLICMALFICISIFYDYIAGFEERELKRKFGRDYLDYLEAVPKWFPRIKI